MVQLLVNYLSENAREDLFVYARQYVMAAYLACKRAPTAPPFCCCRGLCLYAVHFQFLVLSDLVCIVRVVCAATPSEMLESHDSDQLAFCLSQWKFTPSLRDQAFSFSRDGAVRLNRQLALSRSLLKYVKSLIGLLLHCLGEPLPIFRTKVTEDAPLPFRVCVI